jgi:hypothetical protein
MPERASNSVPGREIGMFTLYPMTPMPAVPGKHQGITAVTIDGSENRMSPCWLGYDVRRRAHSESGLIT